MTTAGWTIQILEEEIAAAGHYAQLSRNYTQKKLEQQQSSYSDGSMHSNIVCGRVARDAIARVLREQGVTCSCEDSPHTQATRYCIITSDGVLIQTRFIASRPNYKNLLEDQKSFEQRPHDYYVAITSRDGLNTLEILGYTTREGLSERKYKDFGQGVLNRYVPLSRLQGFDELVAMLRPARLVRMKDAVIR
jgi:hypothetical protein